MFAGATAGRDSDDCSQAHSPPGNAREMRSSYLSQQADGLVAAFLSRHLPFGDLRSTWAAESNVANVVVTMAFVAQSTGSLCVAGLTEHLLDRYQVPITVGNVLRRDSVAKKKCATTPCCRCGDEITQHPWM